MMRSRQMSWSLALLAGALLLAGSTTVRAQGAPPVPPTPPTAGGPGPEHIAALASELGLSAEQQQGLRTLLLGLRKTQIQARADMELAGLELETALEADEPDAKVVGAQVDRLGALETGVRKARMLALLAARKLLTPAQREKLAQRMLALQPPGPPMPPGPPNPPDTQPGALDPFAGGPPRPVRPLKPRMPPADPNVMDPFQRKPTGAGTIMVMANPFAEVWLDGKKLGMTPLRASANPGKHKLELRFQGGPVRVQSVDVRSGETTRLSVDAR
ncbi:MAG: periplasmic heavy metal sensor [Deltaproteobacteria bacterium]|nr:periplasmic heavy metal sensor [Deltaproteobacteria bacterium]